MDESKLVRLSKIMSERGLCSRREADELISQGLVFVDGKRVQELGVKFAPNVDIRLNLRGKRILQRKKTILINKPIGYVSHKAEDRNYKLAIDLIRPQNLMPHSPGVSDYNALKKGLAPAGRLDIESKGLIVLTQDGTVAKKIIGEDSKMGKEYLVRIKGQMIEGGLSLLREGLSLDGQALKPAEVDWINRDQLKFVLTEGKHRQIRRMCEAVGLHVTGLKRVRIGRVGLGNLREGQWRLLGDTEAF